MVSKKGCTANMTEISEFSRYYNEFLDGEYDCIDRIVLSAYFPMGMTPGGFRTWWNMLEETEENLDNTHLMRFAGRFSRRLRAYAAANGITVIDCEKGERKHDIAEGYIPTAPRFKGIFLIMVNRSPANVWDIQRSKDNKKVCNIAHKKNMPYVNHYSFHIIDPEWGHITIKMCGHPPFSAMIMLNGHEYVACQARKEGVEYIKTGNCFTTVSNAARLGELADALCSESTVGLLSQVCDRWIYSSCLYFALTPEEQKQSGFYYKYSVIQMEYSRNFIFIRGRDMDDIFEGIVDRTRSKLDIKSTKTIFGNKRRPHNKKINSTGSRFENIVETPTYNLTVFKLNYDKITAKMYTKGESVLRTEIVVHNSKQLKCGKSLEKFPIMAIKLKDILNQFMDTIYCVNASFISSDNIDMLNTPSLLGKTKVGGIDIQKPRIRAVLQSIIILSAKPGGFDLSDLSEKVKQILGDNEYSIRNAAYDLRKLRGKNIVKKIGKSRRYVTISTGLKTITALLTIREKVIKPVLSGVCKPKRGSKPKNRSEIDIHYENLCIEMEKLFQTIGVAV